MAVLVWVQKEHSPWLTLAEDGGCATMTCIHNVLHCCP